MDVSRTWSDIVGPDRSRTSRPLLIVENQLIVEVDRRAPFTDRELALAIAALGNSQIDRVIVQLVDNVGQVAADRARSRTRRR